MARGFARKLTRELFSGNSERDRNAKELLRYATNPEISHVAHTLAPEFANPYLTADPDTYFDRDIAGTGVQAYVTPDPKAVKQLDPLVGAQLEMYSGPRSLMALNEGLADMYRMGKKGYEKAARFVRSVLRHEHTHRAQGPGIILLNRLKLHTPEGAVDFGRGFVEGATEYTLEANGYTSPTSIWEEGLKPGEKAPTYTWYKRMVGALEKTRKGIVRDVFHAANRGNTRKVLEIFSDPKVRETIASYADAILGKRPEPAYAYATS